MVCRFLGSAGRDITADRFKAQLLDHNVQPCIVHPPSTDAASPGEPSAVSVCLVTPDGQRTMRTCMGAAAQLSPDILPREPLGACQHLHCEGYALYKPDVLTAAIEAAKAAGAIVSLDLASFEVVRQCQDALFALLDSGHVDVVFCNEDESHAFAELAMARETLMLGNGMHLDPLSSHHRCSQGSVHT